MSVYDEIEIEDMEYNAEEGVFYYPCPCGDRFSITKVSAHCRQPARCVVTRCWALQEDLDSGEDIATCPSCSLTVRVIFEPVRGRLQSHACPHERADHRAPIAAGGLGDAVWRGGGGMRVLSVS